VYAALWILSRERAGADGSFTATRRELADLTMKHRGIIRSSLHRLERAGVVSVDAGRLTLRYADTDPRQMSARLWSRGDPDRKTSAAAQKRASGLTDVFAEHSEDRSAP
jgi:hypothetical protein